MKALKKELIYPHESCYDGNLLGLFGRKALAIVITVFTLGICYPWGRCIQERYVVEHTVVDGRRLSFNGKAREMFSIYILSLPLIFITAFIYTAFVDAKIRRWVARHTHLSEES